MALGATQALQSSARLWTPPVKKKRGGRPKERLVPLREKIDKFRGGTPYAGGPRHFSFFIKQNHLGFWKVYRKGGGTMYQELRSDYTSFRACERNLITFLKKYRGAVYPGSDGTS